MRRDPGRFLTTLSLAAAATVLASCLGTGAASRPGAALAAAAATGELTADQLSVLSRAADQHVLIVFRDQHGELPAAGGPGRAQARAGRLAADQARVTGELARLHAPGVHSFRLLNAVTAVVSADEAARLAGDPAVQAVLPDTGRPAPGAQPADTAGSDPTAAPQAAGAAAPGAPAATDARAGGRCPANPATPLVEPEALQLMNVEQQAGSARPAAHDLVDGSGVRVGFVADGLDIHNPDLQRNGRSVVAAYRDFSGQGTAAPSGAAEAFGDASAIAAQGAVTYDLSRYVNPAHPLPTGCTIRVRGVAPGASLVAEKAFGTGPSGMNSVVIQALEAAVLDDHVDVLNESFGGNPKPDNSATDLNAIFNQQAVAAGVTVVASTGDAGSTDTLGSPGTSPGVIAVGASTQYRAYAQTGSYGFPLGAGRWVSDNPSALSSGGVAQLTPRTLDLVAPGDLGWAACTPSPTYTECVNPWRGGTPSNLQLFGGTSQAAPFAAGAAALVIQAYRQTHHGASPAPALVKQILTSSARDLGIAATEQGAGEVDALAAVRLAQSIQDGNGSPAPQGGQLLLSPGSVGVTGAQGSAQVVPVTVTNTGAQPQVVRLGVRRLGAATTIADGTTTLTASDPRFLDGLGRPSTYRTVHFDVAPGTDRLDGALAWDGTANSGTGFARMTLLDPHGHIAAYTLNQGAGGFAQVDVRAPSAGSWTAIVWTVDVGTSTMFGRVRYTMTAQRFETGGTASPSQLTLAPGKAGQVRVLLTTPAQAGDEGLSISVVGDHAASPSSIPVVERSLVRLAGGSGHFGGTLTGGNGRLAYGAQMRTFQFDVPAGTRDLAVDLRTGNAGYQLDSVLVGPDGMAAAYGTTLLLDQHQSPPATVNGGTAALVRRDPQPGRWTFDVLLNLPVVSRLTSHPFTGTVTLNGVRVGATGLPQGQTLAAGKPVQAVVTVRNTGDQPRLYFADPRLQERTTLWLQSQSPTHFTLPLTQAEQPAQFLVPPDTDRLDVGVAGSRPVATDTSPALGDPDVMSRRVSGGNVASVSGAELTATTWSCLPVLIGPFGSRAAPAATAQCGAIAHTARFDRTVTSSTGDFWLSAVVPTPPPFAPLLLHPGETGTITVTLTPGAGPGTTVHGFIGVDTIDPFFPSSNELVNLPYSYTVR